MKEGAIYLIEPNGEKREVDIIELNQLKKDILWMYDQNIGEMNSAFVPSDSFRSKYWKYLTLDGDKWFYKEEKEFYIIGTLIILLCFCVEYNDIEGGDQGVFSKEEFPEIIKYVGSYESQNSSEQALKDKIMLGLEMANSMTELELLTTDFKHIKQAEFLKDINRIADTFILNYYEEKIKDGQNWKG